MVRSAVLGVAVVCLAGLTGVAARAGTPDEGVLYSFKGAPKDGLSPRAPLIQGSDGAFYGTTLLGGTGKCASLSCGAVFQLNPPVPGKAVWTETLLYSFAGGKDGQVPYAGLIADSAGAFYGTTDLGGGGLCKPAGGGCGTVYRLVPPASGTVWTETVLYSFKGGKDGEHPYAGLLLGTGGVLYGTTSGGGTANQGTVFKLTPPPKGKTVWTETILLRFNGTDGTDPEAGLLAGKSGVLYGTAAHGGTVKRGTAFSLTPPAPGKTAWTELTLYSFPGGTSGAYPVAPLVADSSGALYGTTMSGGDCSSLCGTVFKLAPPPTGKTTWTATVIHRFLGFDDGAEPVGGLLARAGSVLYGTTSAGGGLACSLGNCGTVFKLTPNAKHTVWTETVLHQFTGAGDGLSPSASLIADELGELYGTTATGGARDEGTVFTVVP